MSLKQIVKKLGKERQGLQKQVDAITKALIALNGEMYGRAGRKSKKHALKGRHLSAAHRRAIREGIARRKKLTKV
jgi:hypothetical protein